MSHRFSSLREARAETRMRLRDRFGRFLPHLKRMLPLVRGGNISLPDEKLLELLLHIDVSDASEQGLARTTYAAANPDQTSEPDFDKLIEDGWVQVVWGHIHVPTEVSRVAHRISKEDRPALKSLFAGRFEKKYKVARGEWDDADLKKTAEAIDRQELAPDAIACQTPRWIAARLWDRRGDRGSNEVVALRRWMDRWKLLGCPSFVPTEAWGDADAKDFADAAFKVLEDEAALTSWADLRSNILKETAILHGGSPSNFERRLPIVPNCLIDRALWLDDNAILRSIMSELEACGDVAGIVRLLLDWIEAEEHALAPHPHAERLLKLAEQKPQLLIILKFALRARPKLLADVLLYPKSSAFACLLIAQWPEPGGAWDRELIRRDDEATRTIAFEDAVSVMGWFLEQGSLSPPEAASLLRWLHSTARPGFIGDAGTIATLLEALRVELIGQSSDTLRKIVENLCASPALLRLGTPEFAAVIDTVDLGKLSAQIDPKPIVEGYVESLKGNTFQIDASRISTTGAAALFQAIFAKSELRHAFLNAVDVVGQLRTSEETNPITREDNVSRSLRAHIRILCRVIAGWQDTLPEDIQNSLTLAVKAGALKDDDAVRIAAFAPHFEVSSASQDRSIASDLGAALRVMSGDARERLLDAVLETDEPMMLAQLYPQTPLGDKERIERRVNLIARSNAGAIRSLPEAQARIEALLNAGLTEAAEEFIEKEKGLKPFGKIGGRDIKQLQNKLRVMFALADWSGIKAIEPPGGLPTHEEALARDTISFYKAIAALNDPAGDKEGAEYLFSQFHSRRPEVAAYVVNLFAARLSLLLGDNLFSELSGQNTLEGHRLLSEAEEMMRHVRAASEDETAKFDSNKALLLLALGKPQEAIQLLSPLRGLRASDAVAAYTAVALARAGQILQAIAEIDQAEAEIGATEVLRAARAHIENGRPYIAAALTSADDDPVRRIRNALSDLLRLDIARQAEALSGAPDALYNFVLDHMRYAAASLTSLISAMKAIQLESKEDDLNTIVRQLLLSRLYFLNWSVGDQSLGGLTAAENPGERDLVLGRDSAEIAIVEALICEATIDNTNLTKHFQKLVCYGNCRLFFYVTYNYLEARTSDLENALRKIAREEVPETLRYRNTSDIRSIDSRPGGFVARYAAEDDEIRVVFLILNMGETLRKRAKSTKPPKKALQRGDESTSEAD